MANSFTWNTIDGDWSLGTNWFDETSATPGPPTSADEADFFGNGGTVTGSGTAGTLGIFGSGAWTLTAGTVAITDVVNIGAGLDVGGTLTTPFLNEYSGPTDLQVLPGGLLTVTGTVSSPINGFLNGINIANTATVDGGTLDSGGQISIGIANQSAAVIVEGGGTVVAWATILGSTSGEPASLLVTGTSTKWSDIGGPVPGASNTGGYLSVGAGYPNGFGTSGTLTVTDGALMSEANQVMVGSQSGDSGTLTVSAGGTLQVGTYLSIGSPGSGTVTVTSGGTLETLGALNDTFNTVGNNAGSSGTLTVTGAGSLASFAGTLEDGNSGAGTVSVLNGGSVVTTDLVVYSGVTSIAQDNIAGITGSTGSLLVDAADWTSGGGLNIGSQGSGTATVQNGAQVTAGTDLTVGGFAGPFGTSASTGIGVLTIQSAGTLVTEGNSGGGADFNNIAGGLASRGTVTVTGAGSLLSFAGAVFDGNAGTGNVSVLNGGSVVSTGIAINSGSTTATSDAIGQNAGAVGVLLVDASHWTTGAGLTDGGSGSGTLTVQNAGTLATLGTLNSTFNTIGNNTGGTGNVTVTGAGSLLSFAGSLQDGNNGSGVISVLNGGSVVTTDHVVNSGTTSVVADSIGGSFGSAGSLLVDASNWTSGGGLIIGNQGRGSATVQDDGSLTASGGLTIGGFNGTVASTGAGALTVQSGGTVTVKGGNNSSFQNVGGGAGSTGRLTVTGAGSLLGIAGVMTIGASGFGDASITNGGSVVTSGTVVNNGTTSVASDSIGASAGGYGSLAVNGGTWSGGGGLSVGSASGGVGEVSLNLGTISVAANASIGNSGFGTLTIGNGGTFLANGTFDSVGNNAGGAGSVIIDAGGSFINSGTQIDVGNNAGSSGSLIINAGGTFTSTRAPETNNALLYIGNGAATASQPPSSGSVLVTGAGALLNTNGNPLAVGNNGQGNLTVAQGGTVVVGSADTSLIYGLALANGAGIDRVTVTDPGSTLTSDGYLLDGRGGTGSLQIENSGSLVVNDSPANGSGIGIGAGRGAGPSSPSNVGGNGIANVITDGALILDSTTSGITVGGNGVNGVLNVNTGGTVLAGTGLTVGTATTASGTIYGGTGALNIGAGGVVRVNDPLLTGYGITIGNANASIGGSITGTATGAASGEAIVSGTGALLDAGGEGIAVGWLSAGALTISQGGSAIASSPDSNVFDALSIGRRASGSVTITDPGSTLTSNGVAYVGRTGSGSLLIENEGSLIGAVDGKGAGGIEIGGAGIGTTTGVTFLLTGGTGSALVTSGGDMFSQQGIQVGTNGTDGSLTVNGGGTVEASQTIVIGDSVFVPSGDTIISPTGSIVSAGTLIGTAGVVNVGPGGELLADGSAVATGSPALVIGNGAASDGALNVAGPGAVATSTGLLVVGNAGVGSLTIQGGATVTAQGANIGAMATGSGIVNISDTGSRLDLTGDLNVGTSGTGALVMGTGTTLTVTGSITIGTSGALDQFGGTIDPTTFTNDGEIVGGNGALLEVTGSMVNNGTYVAEDGAFTLNVGTIDGPGTLAVGSDGELQLNGSVGSGQTVQFLGTGAANGVLTINQLDGFDPAAIDGFSAGDKIAIASTSTLTQSFNDGTLTLSGSAGPVAALTFGGTYTASDFTDAVVTASTNTGSIGAPNPLIGDLINNGTIFAASNTLDVQGQIFGAGTLAVDTDGVLQLDNAIGSGQTVQFADGTGVLALADIAGFAATIGNFNVGDRIAVAGSFVASDSFDAASHTLTLFDASSDTIGTLTIAPSVTNVVFGAGGGDVTATAACFVTGTRIRTERGDVAVEDLREGDRVPVVLGNETRPVIWIGHRHVDCARHPEPRAVWPVRVVAGAFGACLPRRDLYLSPDHAIYVDGVLIPVKHLINGNTIAQVAVAAVTYYHVELSRHDVLLAEGLPAESYLDTGDRSSFANGGVPITMFPDFSCRAREAGGCARLVVTGPELAAARAKVAMRADSRFAQHKGRGGKLARKAG